MAVSLIKDCMKEKIEILTSQAAVTHALDFGGVTKQQVKEQFKHDMQHFVAQDKVESTAIIDAIENNPEIQLSSSYSTTGFTHHTQAQSSASSEQDQEEEEVAEREDFENEE